MPSLCCSQWIICLSFIAISLISNREHSFIDRYGTYLNYATQWHEMFVFLTEVDFRTLQVNFKKDVWLTCLKRTSLQINVINVANVPTAPCLFFQQELVPNTVIVSSRAKPRCLRVFINRVCKVFLPSV